MAERDVSASRLLCSADGDVVLMKVPFGAAFITFKNMQVIQHFMDVRPSKNTRYASTAISELDADWRASNRSVPVIHFESEAEVDAWCADPAQFDFAAHRVTFEALSRNG